MSRQENLDLIDSFEAAYEPIERLISDLSPAALAYLPPVDDAWSLGEHLVHMLDADCSLWFRARRAIAEPGSSVPDWDENEWKGALAYGSIDPKAAFALAKSLRSLLSASLRAKADEDWSCFLVLHPSRGELSLARILAIYTRHAEIHLDYIKRNLTAFENSR